MSHSSVGELDDVGDGRHRIAYETFVNTMSLIHGQIASINDRLDKHLVPLAPTVVSHRGPGAIAAPVAGGQTASNAPGDPIALYDDARGEWAAGLLKSMRETRNCGLASDVYANFVDEVEKAESNQSSIIIQNEIGLLPTPSNPTVDLETHMPTADLASQAPMWREEPVAPAEPKPMPAPAKPDPTPSAPWPAAPLAPTADEPLRGTVNLEATAMPPGLAMAGPPRPVNFSHHCFVPRPG